LAKGWDSEIISVEAVASGLASPVLAGLVFTMVFYIYF